MDLILFIIPLFCFIVFMRFFLKARQEVLEERKRAKPVIRIETVNITHDTTLTLVYNNWTNQFIGQGHTTKDVFVLLHDQFKDQTVSIMADGQEFELNLSGIPVELLK
jgi:hypothetical protein